MKKLILVFALIVLGSCQYAYAQIDEPKVCISQDAANKCAENARVVSAQEAEIAALKASVAERDKSIEELKATNRQNVADLTERLGKTENKLAETTGELIGVKTALVDQRAIIQFLLTNGRKKCGPLNLICVQ